jgi:uncharacterized membrane protein
MSTTGSDTPQQKGSWKTIRAALDDFSGDLGFGIVFGYVLGGLMYIACFVIAFRMKPEEWWLSLLWTFFGGIVGWTAGVLLSPVTESQKETFAGYGKALSAFVSGFVIGKFDVLMKAFGGTLDMHDVVSIGRVLLFGTTFFLGFQFTFIARWKKSEQPQTNKPQAPPAD